MAVGAHFGIFQMTYKPYFFTSVLAHLFAFLQNFIFHFFNGAKSAIF